MRRCLSARILSLFLCLTLSSVILAKVVGVEPVITPGVKIQANGHDLKVDGIAVSTFVVDWNNDGKKDLLVGTYSPVPAVYLFLNIGTDASPVFGEGTKLEAVGDPPAIIGADPFVVDWNNDGKKDLLLGTAYYVLLYTNVGTDSSPGFTSSSIIINMTETTGGFGAKPFVVDWNKDGKKDLLVGHCGWRDHAYIDLYINVGTDVSPSFGVPTHIQAAGQDICQSCSSSPFITDWDEDGKKDLIVRETSQFTFYRNIGTDASPVFGEGVAIQVDGHDLYVYCGDGSSMFSVTDWNNDGVKDLVIGDYYGYVYLYLGHAKTSENYAPPTPSPTSPYNGATGVSLTPTLSCSSVIDPDGDAVQYVFWLDDDSDVWNDRIWTKNNTSPTITVPVNVLEYGKTYYWAVYAHDGKAGSGLSPVWKFTTITASIKAEKTLGVKAGDWIKYEYITIETAGGHPWVKLEVTNTKDTIVTVLWSTGATGGVSIPNLPTFGLTVSWDIKTGGSVYSYFVIHANPKVGDFVTVLPGITLQIKGEDTRTYAGVSRKVVYADYSALGLQYKYFWDKETGVLVESSTIMGGFDFTIKAVETNLWQAGFGGLPLWIVGVVITIVAAATIAFIAFLMKRKQPPTKPQPAPSQLATEVKYCIKCGARMPLDATYCTKCGQKQP